MPSSKDDRPTAARLTLTRKEVDFPLGPGTYLVDVDLKLVPAGREARDVAPRPPKSQQTPDRTVQMVAGALAEGNISGVVEGVQAERQK